MAGELRAQFAFFTPGMIAPEFGQVHVEERRARGRLGSLPPGRCLIQVAGKRPNHGIVCCRGSKTMAVAEVRFHDVSGGWAGQ